jgi:hypothetical protein
MITIIRDAKHNNVLITIIKDAKTQQLSITCPLLLNGLLKAFEI